MKPIAGALPEQASDADILILALDRLDETLDAIQSASAQTGVETHLFVLDQGSRPEVTQRLADAIRMTPRAVLLEAGGNLGVAGGRNLLSGLGRGRVIVALDNDAVFATAGTVAEMVAALDADAGLAAVGCRIVTHGSGSDDLSSWGYPASLLPQAGACFDCVTFVGAGHAIRRSAWERAGGYDAKLFFCWEEFDFCLRAIALGWRIRYRGDIVIRHKVTPEQRVGWSEARWFYFVRNRLYIERKLGSGWVSIAPRAAGYVLKGVRNGLLRATLRAIRGAAGMAPRHGQRLMSAAAQSYLWRNDLVYRGSVLRRLRTEVLGRVGIAAAAGRGP
jgi:GT2 family glycosyltransferase